MLCMLRQEYSVAEAKMTRIVYQSHLAAMRMFKLNQQLNQARLLVMLELVRPDFILVS